MVVDVMKYRIALFALTAIFARNAAAETQPYDFDMLHSRIFFEYEHQGYSTMFGHFRRFSGTLEFDPEDPTASRLDITIPADSIDVFDDELNARLLTDAFFNVAEHPEIRFISTQIVPIDDRRLRVDGSLTMLGVTRPLSLEIVQNKIGVNRQGMQVAGFSGRGGLERAAYGMDFLSSVAGGEVMFRVEVEVSPRSALE
jgi:polyisoprenoid-binding protein YceI